MLLLLLGQLFFCATIGLIGGILATHRFLKEE